jgi:hypothetical protein
MGIIQCILQQLSLILSHSDVGSDRAGSSNVVDSCQGAGGDGDDPDPYTIQRGKRSKRQMNESYTHMKIISIQLSDKKPQPQQEH